MLLLLRHHLVEFGVIEQETALRRHAGDVLIAMLPADIAPRINVPGIQLLGGTIVETADIEHKQCVVFGEIRRRRPVQRSQIDNFLAGSQKARDDFAKCMRHYFPTQRWIAVR